MNPIIALTTCPGCTKIPSAMTSLGALLSTAGSHTTDVIATETIETSAPVSNMATNGILFSMIEIVGNPPL